MIGTVCKNYLIDASSSIVKLRIEKLAILTPAVSSALETFRTAPILSWTSTAWGFRRSINMKESFACTSSEVESLSDHNFCLSEHVNYLCS
jgi:hypothetical protein